MEDTDNLIFADYSVELTRKCKQFSRVCTQLFHKRLKLTMVYPAILHFQTPDGNQKTFQDDKEAEIYVEKLIIRSKQGNHSERTDKTPTQAHKINHPLLKTPKNLKSKTPMKI